MGPFFHWIDSFTKQQGSKAIPNLRHYVFRATRTTGFETAVILLAAGVCSYAHFIHFLPLGSGRGLYISGLCAHAPGAEEAGFFLYQTQLRPKLISIAFKLEQLRDDVR